MTGAPRGRFGTVVGDQCGTAVVEIAFAAAPAVALGLGLS
jgi:hypothetical protein